MKYLIILVVIGCGYAAPAPDAPLLVHGHEVPLLQRTEVRDEAGQFALSYLTGDGIAFAEQGALKPTLDGSSHVLVRQGSYSYQAPDGQVFTVTYVADENGFRPEGKHFPIAPVSPH